MKLDLLVYLFIFKMNITFLYIIQCDSARQRISVSSTLRDMEIRAKSRRYDTVNDRIAIPIIGGEPGVRKRNQSRRIRISRQPRVSTARHTGVFNISPSVSAGEIPRCSATKVVSVARRGLLHPKPHQPFILPSGLDVSLNRFPRDFIRISPRARCCLSTSSRSIQSRTRSDGGDSLLFYSANLGHPLLSQLPRLTFSGCVCRNEASRSSPESRGRGSGSWLTRKDRRCFYWACVLKTRQVCVSLSSFDSGEGMAFIALHAPGGRNIRRRKGKRRWRGW